MQTHFHLDLLGNELPHKKENFVEVLYSFKINAHKEILALVLSAFFLSVLI